MKKIFEDIFGVTNETCDLTGVLFYLVVLLILLIVCILVTRYVQDRRL